MKESKSFWRLWAKSIGEKGSKCDKESDHIAGIRTIIFTTYLITNVFIVAGVIRHWSNGPYIHLHYYEVPSSLYQEQEKEADKTSRNVL